MSLLLTILLILIAFSIALLKFPHWVLWQMQAIKERRQFIRKYQFQHRLHDKATILIGTESTLFSILLLRFMTNQKITWANQTVQLNQFEAFLLKLARITQITSEQISTWSEKGVLFVSESDKNKISKAKQSILLAYICGNGHLHHKKNNLTYPLQLSLSKPLNKQSLEDLYTTKQKMSVYAWNHYVSYMPSIQSLWLRQAKARKNKLAVADSTGVALPNTRLLIGALSMSQHLREKLANEPRVGICMPPSVGGTLACLASFVMGKTIVNLNYTASQASLDAAINEAGIKTIITSYRFVEQLKKKGFDVGVVFKKSNIIYLEEVKQQMKKIKLIQNALMVKFLPASFLIKQFVTEVSTDDTAVILFSSGSEGKPKGVELTHKNIIGNAMQSAVALTAKENDVILHILPIFHAFGLTANTMLPLLEGMSFICHPDPRDAVAIGHIAAQYKATILCATSTFFRLYTKSRGLKPEMLDSLRLIVAGAERLQPEVRKLFEKKFEKEILEGYGTTEMSPVASVNIPETAEHPAINKIGTIGPTIPGSMCRIIDPESKEDLKQGEAGMITIGGVNIMKGYLHMPEKTDSVLFEQDGIRWYMSGDKGKIDKEGFITILDRYSRFAKLGGEMVSLSAVENAINTVLDDPEHEVLAIALPDLKKGELVALMYTSTEAEDVIKSKIIHSDIHNMYKPAVYLHTPDIPKLGTGKTDFSAAKKLALHLHKKKKPVAAG